MEAFFPFGIFEKLGNITRIFSSFSWGISSYVTRLDQSRASKYISWSECRQVRAKNLIVEVNEKLEGPRGARVFFKYSMPEYHYRTMFLLT